MSSAIRARIAGCTFNKQNFNEILALADEVYFSNSAAASVNAVSIAALQPDLDETQPAMPYPQPEVAAFGRGGRGGRGGFRGGRGFRGNRGNRGGGGSAQGGNSNNSNPSSSTQPRSYKGPKHPDLPNGAWTGCQMHHRWGRSAHFCSEPSTCPWKDVFTPKPAK